jgi:hypothetical protein
LVDGSPNGRAHDPDLVSTLCQRQEETQKNGHARTPGWRYFKIVAKAYPAAQGGFIAAVDIQRVRPEMLPHVDVVYSNGKLFRGHQFEDAHSALVRAMDVGHQMIRGLITVAA